MKKNKFSPQFLDFLFNGTWLLRTYQQQQNICVRSDIKFKSAVGKKGKQKVNYS